VARVVAIGYDEQSLLAAQPALHAFPHSLSRQDLRRLLAVLEAEIADGHEVLVVQPTWLSGPAERRLQIARAALDASRLTLYTSALPPLAGAALCALAAALGELVPAAGVLHAAMPALERSLVPFARLATVARLAHPRPDAAQRALSAWPGAAFGVSWWPHPHLRTLRMADEGVSLPPAMAWEGPPLVRVAVAAPPGTALTWLEDSVLPAFGTPAVVLVDPPSFTGTYWGTQRVVEAVAYPTDVRGLVPVIGAHGTHRCPWCGAVVAERLCPFCELTPMRSLPAAT